MQIRQYDVFRTSNLLQVPFAPCFLVRRVVVVGCVLFSFAVGKDFIASKHFHNRTANWKESLLPHNVHRAVFGEVSEARYIYLVQGPREPPEWLSQVGMRNDTQVIYGSYKLRKCSCKGITRNINIPNSTWTTGRNSLYNEALKLQEQQGWRAEYLIFADNDAQLFADDDSVEPYGMLHSVLSNIQPAVAAVGFPRGNVGRNKCGFRTPCAPDVDGAFNAFHATAVNMFVPYEDIFDNESWWASQAIMIELFKTSIPEYVVQLNQFYLVQDASHSSYPRGSRVFARPRSGGMTTVERYLYGAVSKCMHKKLGYGTVGASELGYNCHRCRITEMCEASPTCSRIGKKMRNYSKLIKCPPYPLLDYQPE